MNKGIISSTWSSKQVNLPAENFPKTNFQTIPHKESSLTRKEANTMRNELQGAPMTLPIYHHSVPTIHFNDILAYDN